MNSSLGAPVAVITPRFERPPVVETALGIQFAQLPSFTNTHFGLFFETVRDRYPVSKDQPRLAPIHEAFPRRRPLPEFSLQLTDAKPVERVWFIDAENGANLIQVQPDRFGFNWRKREVSEPYPTFQTNGPRCIDEFNRFRAFCVAEGLGEVVPNLCEVVYVNHIFPPPGTSVVDDFAKVFHGVSWQNATGWLRIPELISLNRVYVIGNNQGRLYAEASIGSHKDRGDFISLKMVGRVLCGPNDDVADGLKLAHDWVVNGFECLTDARVRIERWGQKP